MTRQRRAVLVAAILLACGTTLVARAGWIAAKGWVGELLVDRALTATLADGRPRRPWRWADMHPVARLRVPSLGVERPILSNASGSAMAFGLGHLDGTAGPGAHGNSVVAGHRDSWAAFLADLRAGDSVLIDLPSGTRAFRVTDMRVVRHDDGSVAAEAGSDRLTLVTCWPFRGWLHSPWRYVVRCEPDLKGAATSPW